MALSFKKHEEKISQAWKSVLDDKNPCDWVLFGYDGQSNDLKVESTGKYGLEELSQEFNPGKVLFAFCKVKNPKSNLPLFILINWVGEGAPLNRKSSSPPHSFSIKKYLKYSSLTINARVEEDVEPEAILERIKKTSTTDFDFSAKIQNECLENIGPVSTNYVRIKPEKDINLNEKKKFWSNLEKENDEIKKEKEIKEKETKENERNLINNRLNNKTTIIENNNEKSHDDLVVKKINKLKINSELSEREKFWAQEEEEENKQKKEENKKKLQEKKAIENELKNRELSAKLIMNNFNNLSSNDVKIKKINAIDEINLEKKKLLSTIKNTINDNDILENNSLNEIESNLEINNEQSSDNQSFNEPSLEDYVNELNETYVKESALPNDLYDNYTENDKNLDDEDVDDEAYENEYCLDDKSLKLSPDYLSKRLFFEPLEDIAEEDEDCQDEEYQEEDNQEEDNQEEDDQEENNQEEECLNEELQKFLEGKGKCAKALFDYQASDDTEISFDPNDIITNINQVFESWWEGLGPDNKLGLFPANYVQLLN